MAFCAGCDLAVKATRKITERLAIHACHVEEVCSPVTVGEVRRSFVLTSKPGLPMLDRRMIRVPRRGRAGPPAGAEQGWMFHLDRRNVTTTSWTPLVLDGRVAGFRVRLLETAGRTVHTRLSAYRPINAAYKLNFAGQTMGSCSVREGGVAIDLGAHEWLELEARW